MHENQTHISQTSHSLLFIFAIARSTKAAVVFFDVGDVVVVVVGICGGGGGDAGVHTRLLLACHINQPICLFILLFVHLIFRLRCLCTLEVFFLPLKNNQFFIKRHEI